MRGSTLGLLLTLTLGLLGCGGRGDARFGAPCGRDRDCAEGLCVAGVDGPDSVCTKSCGHTSDCPREWACSGVTQSNVLVCSHGSPTPFGIGANEGDQEGER